MAAAAAAVLLLCCCSWWRDRRLSRAYVYYYTTTHERPRSRAPRLSRPPGGGVVVVRSAGASVWGARVRPVSQTAVGRVRAVSFSGAALSTAPRRVGPSPRTDGRNQTHRGSAGRRSPSRRVGPAQSLALIRVPWLILPVVICLSQRLSHACLSASHIKVKPRKAH